MGDDSGDDEGDEAEKDWVWQGWGSETVSLFQKWGDAYRNERCVIFNEESEELAWKGARVTTEEAWVQRGGWREIRY